MGMREKRREKKSKAKAEDEPASTEDEKTHVIEQERRIHKPDVVIIESEDEKLETTETLEEIIVEDVVVPESRVLLPQWGNITDSEWMYAIPSRDDDRRMWAEEWGDFLLEWAQANSVHVFSLSTFLKETPFNDLSGKVDAFRLIGQTLVDKEVADWLDRGRRQIRIYWRPLEDWADIVYEWAIKTGTTLLDLKSIIIQEADEDFAKLPERDIAVVLSLIVERELAVWVDRKKHAIKIEH
ncbi:MAG: hypothetical protein ACFFEJ_14100 [Candidatus Thorarchaeota archaeon]